MIGAQIGQWAAIATAFLWTLSILSWTSAGKQIGSVAVGFWRMILATLYLVVYLAVVRGAIYPTEIEPRAQVLLGVSGFFGFCVGDICLFRSLLVLGPRITLLFQTLAPPLAAILSWCYLGEPLEAKQWAAMAVTLSGVAWVVMERGDLSKTTAFVPQWRVGVPLAVAAAVCQAVGAVLGKQGIGSHDAVAATLIRVLAGTAGYFVFISVARLWKPMLWAARQVRVLPLMLVGTTLGPFLGVIMYMVALRNCHAGVVATIVNTMPVIVLPFVIIFYRERVSMRAFLGALVAVCGVALLKL
jgi:drug/metabolite transporter (DMT)-like permease